MYSRKGVKSVKGAVSASAEWHLITPFLPPTPVFSASVGVHNDRVQGIENNQRKAVQWGIKFVDAFSVDDLDREKIESPEDL